MEKPLLDKNTAKQSSSDPTSTIQRQAILNSLWNDAEWLDTQIHKQRISRSTHRLKMIKVKAYICSILLSGLKDQELDRIMEEIEAIKAHVGVKE